MGSLTGESLGANARIMADCWAVEVVAVVFCAPSCTEPALRPPVEARVESDQALVRDSSDNAATRNINRHSYSALLYFLGPVKISCKALYNQQSQFPSHLDMLFSPCWGDGKRAGRCQQG